MPGADDRRWSNIGTLGRGRGNRHTEQGGGNREEGEGEEEEGGGEKKDSNGGGGGRVAGHSE